jgi:GNAT superfamily N-acetyltransferase
MSAFSGPVPLLPTHVVEGFSSGQPSLDQWLLRRSWRNSMSGASRTFVITQSDDPAVIGFYSLAASSVRLADAPGPVKRNMPNPIPVILLGRLAIDRRFQGHGLGRALLKDAFRRVLAAADIVGIRALLVHAIDQEAKSFYQRFGFVVSPIDEFTLFLPVKSIIDSIIQSPPTAP